MKHLRYAVKLHLKSQGHRWATDEAAAVKEAAGARRDVGLNVARTVYDNLMKGSSVSIQ